LLEATGQINSLKFIIKPATKSISFKNYVSRHLDELSDEPKSANINDVLRELNDACCGVYAFEKNGKLVAYAEPVVLQSKDFHCANCKPFPKNKPYAITFYDKYSSTVFPRFINEKESYELIKDFVINAPSYFKLMPSYGDDRDKIKADNYFVFVDAEEIGKNMLNKLKNDKDIEAICDHDIYCYLMPKKG